MIDTKQFYDCLVNHDMDFFAGVPDSLLKQLCACIGTNSDDTHNIITANEGNAIAVAAGYHLSTGKYGVVYMQNSGEGNTVNPLMSLTDEDVYNIPLLMIIGWRGEPGIHDEPQHVKQGKVTLSLLETMGIKYMILSDDYAKQIEECYDYMKQTNKPVALVVHKNSFSDYPFTKPVNNHTLSREQALEEIIKNLHSDEFIVSTTGMCSREIFEIRERNGQGHGNDFLTVGSMGHTSSIAFGVAVGTDKDVYCIDGDGSFIMHMGASAVIAQKAPDNYHYILINNGVHDSVGGQPTVAYDIDCEGVLKAVGYKQVYSAETLEDIKENIAKLRNNPKSALVVYCRQGARKDLGRPTTTPVQNKEAFMKELKK